MYSSNRIVLVLVFGLILNFALQAQIVESTDYDPDQIVLVSDSNILGSVFSEQIIKPKEKKWDTGLNVGASFMYSPGNFYGPSYFAAPSLSYKVYPRFILSAGVGLEYSTLYPVYAMPGSEDQMLPMTRFFLHASGTYLVNQRLSVTGTVYKAIDYVPNLNKQTNPGFDYQGFSMGVNYKITQNISFGVHMRVQEGGGYGSGFGYGPGYGLGSGGFGGVPGFGSGGW